MSIALLIYKDVLTKVLFCLSECPDGSFGPGCAPCLPKKYGRFCASTCYCSVELCNAVTGCSEGKLVLNLYLKRWGYIYPEHKCKY